MHIKAIKSEKRSHDTDSAKKAKQRKGKTERGKCLWRFDQIMMSPSVVLGMDTATHGGVAYRVAGSVIHQVKSQKKKRGGKKKRRREKKKAKRGRARVSTDLVELERIEQIVELAVLLRLTASNNRNQKHTNKKKLESKQDEQQQQHSSHAAARCLCLCH